MYLILHLLLFTLLFSFTFFLLHVWRRKNERKIVHRRPPEPQGLPLIGNLHQLVSSLPHLYLHELSKIYGPIISLKLGFVPTLVISSAKMAKEVMKTQDLIFSNRPKLATQQKMSYNGLDIVFAPYDEQWRQLKKVSALHLFSAKKVHSFSSIREEEAHQMTQKISCLSDDGVAIDLSEMMTCFTNDVICKIAFGRKYNHVRIGRSFEEMLKDAEEILASLCFSDYFPSLGWVLDKITGMSSRLDKVFMEWDELYEEIINDHLNSTRPKDGQEDILDVLLELRRENSMAINITMDHIKAILMNIVMAGTDTSAATVVWAMTQLMKNPEAMKRVQEEARTLIPNETGNRMIKEEDVEKLVYLKAVVKETFRLHPVDPLLVPRETTRDCTIQGYEIKEKTLVFVNAWAIGRDPESWENPEVFEPERFMDGNKAVGIDFRGQDFELIPFGSGRRICPGMQMGVAMLELALANLVYSFDWEVPLGMEKQVLDTSSLPGISVQKKYPLCLVATKASC